MSLHDQVVQENRRKVVDYLRTTDDRQGYGSMHNATLDAYCAKGAMCKALDHDVTVNAIDNYKFIDDALNLSQSFSRCIERWNDLDELTFPQIADKLAAEWGIE